MEVRIQDLKRSSSADQSEIKALRAKLKAYEQERTQIATRQEDVAESKRALQALENRRREEIRERDKVIADLEKSLASEKRKRELAEARIDDVRAKDDEQVREARSAAQRSEAQLNDARNQVRLASAALAILESKSAFKEEELTMQLEQFRSILAAAAEQYGQLASTTIPLPVHTRVKYKNSALRLRVLRLETKLANAKGQVAELANLVRHTTEENRFLSAQLRDVEDEVNFYSHALKDAKNVRDNRSEIIFERSAREDLAVIQEENALESEAACQVYRLMCEELWPLCSLLEDSLRERDELVQQYAVDLDATSTARNLLASQLEALEADHEEQLKNLIKSRDELKATSETSGKQWRETEARMLAEMSKHEEMMRKERDTVQRLTSTIQKSRMAEDGLRAEVDQ